MRRAFSTPNSFESQQNQQQQQQQQQLLSNTDIACQAPELSSSLSPSSSLSANKQLNNHASFHLNVPLREIDERPSNCIQQQSHSNGINNEMQQPSVSTISNNNSVYIEGSIHKTNANGSNDQLDESAIDITIRNVVCSYTLPFHIDLRQVALNCSSVTFDRGRGVLLKQKRHPSCFAKIYSSGKVYLVGCRSEAECKRAARGVARMLQRSLNKLSLSIRMRNYRVCNVLATCKLPFGIKIEELAQKYPSSADYEPELSVGLIWRSTTPKATLRIHTTGSITVTGAVSEDDVMRVIELIYPIVREFRCACRLRDADTMAAANAERKRKQQKRRIGEYDEANSHVSDGMKRRRNPQQQQQHRQQHGIQSSHTSSSGAIGNRLYFSDEDDEFEQ